MRRCSAPCDHGGVSLTRWGSFRLRPLTCTYGARPRGVRVDGPTKSRKKKPNDIAARVRAQGVCVDGSWHTGACVVSRSIPPPWGSIRFRLAHHTYAPWGCIARVVSQTRSRKIPTLKPLPLYFVIRACANKPCPPYAPCIRVFNSTTMAVNPTSPAHPHVRSMGVHRTCR